ncbi:MAG: homocysteine S-methyltransferase family protein [Chloroflexota bacterium]
MNPYKRLMQRLHNGEKIVIDGATGTEIERRGVPQVKHAWNGGGALSHPDILRQVHEDYIRNGAEIVISNTFATGRHVLRDAGWEEHFDLLNRRGVEIADEARANVNAEGVLVAGGITHWSFTSQHPPYDELHANVSEQANIMKEAGADLLMLEMMVDIERMLVLLDAAQQTGLPVWVGFSTKADDEGVIRLWDGPTLADAIAAIEDKDVPLVNIMHTYIQYIEPSLDVLDQHWSGLVGVYAQSGGYIKSKWLFDEVLSPEDYAAEAQKWLDRGVQVVGGCCGVGVDHIAMLNTLVG